LFHSSLQAEVFKLLNISHTVMDWRNWRHTLTRFLVRFCLIASVSSASFIWVFMQDSHWRRKSGNVRGNEGIFAVRRWSWKIVCIVRVVWLLYCNNVSTWSLEIVLLWPVAVLTHQPPLTPSPGTPSNVTALSVGMVTDGRCADCSRVQH